MSFGNGYMITFCLSFKSDAALLKHLVLYVRVLWYDASRAVLIGKYVANRFKRKFPFRTSMMSHIFFSLNDVISTIRVTIESLSAAVRVIIIMPRTEMYFKFSGHCDRNCCEPSFLI